MHSNILQLSSHHNHCPALNVHLSALAASTPQSSRCIFPWLAVGIGRRQERARSRAAEEKDKGETRRRSVLLVMEVVVRARSNLEQPKLLLAELTDTAVSFITVTLCYMELLAILPAC